MNKVSAIWASANPCWNKSFKKTDNFRVEKYQMTFKTLKILKKVLGSTSDKNTVSWIVSSSSVACAYAYKMSTADLHGSLALANYATKSSCSLYSDDWSAFESGCRSTKFFLIESVS